MSVGDILVVAGHRYVEFNHGILRDLDTLVKQQFPEHLLERLRLELEHDPALMRVRVRVRHLPSGKAWSGELERRPVDGKDYPLKVPDTLMALVCLECP